MPKCDLHTFWDSVVHDPLPDNYAHSLITGNITRSIAKRLAAAASKIQVD